MKSKLKAAFESEMALAVHFIQAGRMEQAMRHLERAHVLGQTNILPYVRSHWHKLKDCEPPETSITASVFPCAGRTAPMDSDIQSICAKRARR